MSRKASYFARLKATLGDVIENLRAKGIDERHLAFGGEGTPPVRKPTVPTDARSEFLANRAMGDWAEQRLSAALKRAIPDLKVVQYGSTDRIAAGHPEFKTRYLAELMETLRFGKRPDLLLFPAGVSVNADLAECSHKETEALVRQAAAAVEVRSSKFEALTYMKVRQQQRAAGKTTARKSPSFTVKVEDLIIVYRWLERYCVTQSYFQVFFDSVFAINFLDIFTIIRSGNGFTIEKPKKSQEKATIMIPITCGKQVGRATAMATFAAEHRVTELGRHDAYVVPKGGGIKLNKAETRNVLMAER